MKKALLIVGVIGAVLSLCVVGVSASMPALMGPRASWGEAMMGIVPGAVCFFLFAILAVVGLILVLMAPSAKSPNKKRKRHDDKRADGDERDPDEAD